MQVSSQPSKLCPKVLKEALTCIFVEISPMLPGLQLLAQIFDHVVRGVGQAGRLLVGALPPA